MVASFNEGNLVRSYVRVPGSGIDKTAKPALCDLSRVSTIIAPLPQYSRIEFIATNTTLNSNIREEKPKSIVSNNLQNTKRPRDDDKEDNSNQKEKQKCVQDHNPSTDVTNGKNGHQMSRKIYHLKKINATSELNQMLIQNHQLKQEKRSLQKQISLFKQLIKEPKRLKSVLNRLNIPNEI
ncbi:unnamed protein product [Meganyctiphanes norvegica]|uniref:Uncharacterized protein n=1 Tax=Meganyctiphanes norvegica TaxID=48144 RepID=A0AAV2QBR6_MEGNR